MSPAAPRPILGGANAMKILFGILALCFLVAGALPDRSRAGEDERPFYFQDRPGEIPPLPVANLEIPSGGFQDGVEFERWLVGTIWEGGGDAKLRLVLVEPGRAEFTWSNPAWWKVTGNKRCSLSHERSHWWCDLVFSDDYQTLRFENGGRSNGQGFSWGEAKLVGRK